MADFEQALDALLSDPESMQQILSLAEKLNPEAATSSDDKAAEQAQPPLDFTHAAELSRLMDMVHVRQKTDDRAEAMIQAIRPFLREDRQRKLDRALRFVGLSQSAQQVFRLLKEGELHL